MDRNIPKRTQSLIKIKCIEFKGVVFCIVFIVKRPKLLLSYFHRLLYSQVRIYSSYYKEYTSLYRITVYNIYYYTYIANIILVFHISL